MKLSALSPLGTRKCRPLALLQKDREQERPRDGQPHQPADLGHGGPVGLRGLGGAGQRRDPVVAQDVLDAGGQPLVDHSGQAGHAAAIERLQRHRGVAVASVLPGGQEILLQRANRARGAVAEPAVDAGPQVAERSQILLQDLGEGIGWSRSGPQHEPGLTIRTPHRSSQPTNRPGALSTRRRSSGGDVRSIRGAPGQVTGVQSRPSR